MMPADRVWANLRSSQPVRLKPSRIMVPGGPPYTWTRLEGRNTRSLQIDAVTEN